MLHTLYMIYTYIKIHAYPSSRVTYVEGCWLLSAIEVVNRDQATVTYCIGDWASRVYMYIYICITYPIDIHSYIDPK